MLRPVSIKTRILLLFLMVILVLSVPIAALGHRAIQKNIIRRADRQVSDSMIAAGIVYTGEIERIGEALKLVTPNGDLEARRRELAINKTALNLKRTSSTAPSIHWRDAAGGGRG